MLETENDPTSEVEHTYYSKAPITEAVIDLRVSLPESHNIEELKEALKEDYPTAEALLEIMHSLTVDGPSKDVESSTEKTFGGYKLSNQAGKRIIIARPTGFTFSQLAPYETWEPFYQAAHCAWKVYRDILKPQSINRIAVRYINRIDIPPGEDFDRYLLTYPEISKKMSQEVTNFFMQLELPQRDINSTAVINQTIVSSPGPHCVSLLLDVDLFRILPPEFSEEEVWLFFNKLRVRKDEIFEACITDLVREEIR